MPLFSMPVGEFGSCAVTVCLLGDFDYFERDVNANMQLQY